MALAVGGGGGSEGGTTKAVTRLAVVDPHLVIMMRDVMDASETAARLTVGGGAGSGGGGAGDAPINNSGTGGIDGSDGTDRTILNCQQVNAARTAISIGDYTMIGPNTIIADHNSHRTNPKDRWSTRDNPLEINIGKNCWIGMNCTILKGVNIGDNTVIGASSVVIEDCEPNSIYRGNPAKKIRNI